MLTVCFFSCAKQLTRKNEDKPWCDLAVKTLLGARCSFPVGEVNFSDVNITCPYEYALGIEEGRLHCRGRRPKFTPTDLVVYNKSTGYLHIVYQPIANEPMVRQRMRQFKCARCEKDISTVGKDGNTRWGNDSVSRRDPLEKLFDRDVRLCKACYQAVNCGIISPLKNGPLLQVFEKIERTISSWVKTTTPMYPEPQLTPDSQYSSSQHMTDILFSQRVGITLPPTSYFNNDQIDSNGFLFTVEEHGDINSILNNNSNSNQYENSLEDYANDLIETSIPKQQNVAELLKNPEVKNFCIEFAKYVIKRFGGGLATTNIGMDTTWDYWIKSINDSQQGKLQSTK